MDNFSYDITAEDALSVFRMQRDNLLDQFTTAQIELRKARDIIAHQNEELLTLRNTSTKVPTKSANTKAKKKVA